MSRAPDQATMLAIAGALDARDTTDRARRHDSGPARPGTPIRPLLPRLPATEVARMLRGIDRDISAILARPADLAQREMTLAALGGQLLAIADMVEGRP